MPAYQDFQVKARQKEAPSLLSGYFIAAQAAKVEHGGYAGNFTAHCPECFPGGSLE